MYNIREEYCGNQNGQDCIESCSCWQAILQIKYRNNVQKCKINVYISKGNELISPSNTSYSKDNFSSNRNNGYSNNPPSNKVVLSVLPISSKFFSDNSPSSQLDSLEYALELNLINNDALKKMTEINSQFSLCKFDIYINSNIHSQKMFDKNLHVSLDPYIILKSIEVGIEKHKENLKHKNNEKIDDLCVKLLDEKTNIFLYLTLPQIHDFTYFTPSLENLLVQNINITRILVEMKIPRALILREKPMIDYNCPEFFPKREIHNVNHNHNIFLENIKENININNFIPSPIFHPKEKIQISSFNSIDYLSPNQEIFHQNGFKSNKKNLKKNKKKENNVKLFVRRLETKANNETISVKTDDNYCNESKNEYSIYSLKAKNLSNFNKFDLANKDKQNPLAMKKHDKEAQDRKFKPVISKGRNDVIFEKFAGKNDIKIKISNQIQNNYIINNSTNQFFYTQALNFNYNNVNINQYNDPSYYLMNDIPKCSNNFHPRYGTNNHYKMDNLCNVDIFMTNTTPIYLDSEKTLIKDILFSFERASILGLESVLKNSGTSCLSNYTPTLSSLKIEVIAKRENFCQKTDCFTYPTITLINFSEDQNLSNRLNLIEKLQEIFDMVPELHILSLSQLTESSYFTLLWTPTKSNRGFSNSTSFLVFYKFREKSISNAIRAISVIGMISNITDDDFWFKNQLTPYNNLYMNDALYNKLVKDFLENKCKYLQIKDSCQEFIKLNRYTNNNADCNTISDMINRKNDNFLLQTN